MPSFAMCFETFEDLQTARTALEQHLHINQQPKAPFLDNGNEQIKKRLISQIFNGLTYRPLSTRQEAAIKMWAFKPNDWTHTNELKEHFVKEGLAADNEDAKNKVRGVLSGLGVRMSQKVRRPQMSTYSPPLEILVQIRYDDVGSSSHKLTEAGLRAVEMLLE